MNFASLGRCNKVASFYMKSRKQKKIVLRKNLSILYNDTFSGGKNEQIKLKLVRGHIYISASSGSPLINILTLG